MPGNRPTDSLAVSVGALCPRSIISLSIQYKIINRKKLLAVRGADAAANTLAKVGAFRRGVYTPILANREAIKRILVVRLAYIGDVVMTLPVVAPLKRAFPDAQIDFLTATAAAPFVESHPDLNDVIGFNAPWFHASADKAETDGLVQRLQDNDYDLGIDFRGDLRNIYHCLWRPRIPRRLSYTSGGGGALLTHSLDWHELKHKVEFHLDLLREMGIDAPTADPEIVLSADERDEARKLLSDALEQGHAPPVASHPGARLDLKRYPVERFAELTKRISQDTGRPIILVGTPDDEPRAAIIKQSGKVAADLTSALSIRMLAAVFSQCACLICHDSAAMHISAAVGTPVVAVFGPSRPAETSPCIAAGQVLEGPCPRKDACDETTCLEEDQGHCILSIAQDDVYARTMAVLAG